MKLLDIELGTVKLLRYFHGGIIIIFVIVIIKPEFLLERTNNGSETIFNTLGSTISIIIILFTGATIYLLQRYIIGELFLYRLIHWIHDKFDFCANRTFDTFTSPTAYLAHFLVTESSSRDAYIYIRRNCLHKGTSKALDLAHTELHMMWITLYGAIVIVCHYLPFVSIIWGIVIIIGIIIFILLMFKVEMLQFGYETRLLRKLNRNSKLTKTLDDAGFILNPRFRNV